MRIDYEAGGFLGNIVFVSVLRVKERRHKMCTMDDSILMKRARGGGGESGLSRNGKLELRISEILQGCWSGIKFENGKEIGRLRR